jgi:hypothetical protein
MAARHAPAIIEQRPQPIKRVCAFAASSHVFPKKVSFHVYHELN